MPTTNDGRQTRERGSGLGELLLLAAASTLALSATASRVFPLHATHASAGAAAQELHTYLQLARVEALSLDRPCRVVVAPAEGVMRVLDSANQALHERPWPAQIEVALDGGAFAEGSFTIEFRPNGEADTLAVTLTGGSGEQAMIAVGADARIEIDVPDGA
jgi:hypothetical protein